MPVHLICAICGTPFKVPPARIRNAQKRGTYPKYCKKACANIGQSQNRIPWSRGLTKETDERIQKRSDVLKQDHQEHPEKYCGDNHGARKQPLTPERLEHLARMRELKPKTATPKQLEALATRRLHYKGHTKGNDPVVARRAKILSEKYKGRKNPEHGEWMRNYYDEHPEKNPHFIQASKDHETSIERIMRLALDAENIVFQSQYRVGRFCIDFAILSHHLAIEVDGEYWHKVKNERDTRRDEALLDKGWSTIRFSESRVNQEIHLCISEIQDLLLQ